MSTVTVHSAAEVSDVQELPPEDENRYEVVDGMRVEMPPISAYSSFIGARVAKALDNFAADNDLGRAFPEVLLRLPLPVDRQRRPDAAFISFARWPRDLAMPEDTNAWELAPELMVEVVSPSDICEDLYDKIGEYFQAEAKLVWIVYPRHRVVWVFDSPTAVRIVTETGSLEGGDELPGFRLPLSELFPPRA